MKAVLLLSGGIDSPVAGRMLLDQGVELEAVHASFEPITDDQSVHKAKELAGLLGLEHLWVAKTGDALGRIPADRDAHRHYFILQKRLFYRLADQVADTVDASAIVTGENLGQVSSQTLQNLVSIEAVTNRPVLRPLLGLDKVEIIQYAKEHGTYETSIGPELCDLLGPDKPATTSKADKVADLEARVGLADPIPRLEKLPVSA